MDLDLAKIKLTFFVLGFAVAFWIGGALGYLVHG